MDKESEAFATWARQMGSRLIAIGIDLPGADGKRIQQIGAELATRAGNLLNQTAMQAEVSSGNYDLAGLRLTGRDDEQPEGKED